MARPEPTLEQIKVVCTLLAKQLREANMRVEALRMLLLDRSVFSPHEFDRALSLADSRLQHSVRDSFEATPEAILQKILQELEGMGQ